MTIRFGAVPVDRRHSPRKAAPITARPYDQRTDEARAQDEAQIEHLLEHSKAHFARLDSDPAEVARLQLILDNISELRSKSDFVDPVESFRSRVWEHITGTERGDLHCYRVSLTGPPSSSRIVAGAQTMANEVAKDTRGAAWFLLDIGERSGTVHAHHYGFALTSRPREWFTTRWIELTGATSGPHPWVIPVTGERREWNAANTTFRLNLAKVINYAVKPLPHGHTPPLASRVIASGVLARISGETIGAATQIQPSRSRQGALPLCAHCDVAIPHAKATQGRYLNASHRSLAWRARVTLLNNILAAWANDGSIAARDRASLKRCIEALVSLRELVAAVLHMGEGHAAFARTIARAILPLHRSFKRAVPDDVFIEIDRAAAQLTRASHLDAHEPATWPEPWLSIFDWQLRLADELTVTSYDRAAARVRLLHARLNAL